MKIALTFPACHRRCGVERVVLEVANYLASGGHDIQLISSEVSGDIDPRVRLILLPRGKIAALELYRFRKRATRVLMNVPGHAFGAFGVQSPANGIVWVQSVHARWLQISKAKRRGWAKLRQRLNPFHYAAINLEKRCFRLGNYRRLIALSDQVKNDLQELYDVPSDDIDVLPNGYSPKEFNLTYRSTVRAAMRKQHGIADNQRTIAFVANELERKGFAPLMRAIARLKRPDVTLLVVGRVTPERYRKEMRRLEISDQVRFVGPTTDVAKFYAAADIFALPTEYEAWGLVIVEALACGLPVLTSRLAGAAVAVREGVTGELLDDPSSVSEIAYKLERLLARPTENAPAIAESVEAYAWPNILARYEQILIENSDR